MAQMGVWTIMHKKRRKAQRKLRKEVRDAVQEHTLCVLEKDSSVDPNSLLAEYTVFLLNLVEVKGQQELLEIEEEWEEEVGWNGELKVEE